jgi:hypothetical protein
LISLKALEYLTTPGAHQTQNIGRKHPCVIADTRSPFPGLCNWLMIAALSISHPQGELVAGQFESVSGLPGWRSRAFF